MPKVSQQLASDATGQFREILGIALATVSLLLLFGLLSYMPDDPHVFHPNPEKEIPGNWIGTFGALLSDGLFRLLGTAAYIVPFGLAMWAWRCFAAQGTRVAILAVVGWIGMVTFGGTLFSIGLRGIPTIQGGVIHIVMEVDAGGMVGNFIADFLNAYFASFGRSIIVISGLLLSVLAALPISLGSISRNTTAGLQWIARTLTRREEAIIADGKPATGALEPMEPAPLASMPVPIPSPELSMGAMSLGAPPVSDERLPFAVYQGNGKEFSLPDPNALLTVPRVRPIHNRDEQSGERSRLLVQAFKNFGVVGTVTAIHPGPVVTMYEFEPAPGIKVSRIVSLSNDLALAMKAETVRIVAPIPGKAVVGIEIPSVVREDVHLKDLLMCDTYQKASWKLKVVLGKDIFGMPVVVDLQAMPHLLMAGATGAGKSVGLNTMITSLLFAATPYELQFLMVDPKMLELQGYNGIPHLLRPVITNAKVAAKELLWAVREMERRYQLMADAGARNINHYNYVISNSGEEIPEILPYIVIIVDELADLMMVSSREVEESITRLAQMARASGMHLILATQRPSVDVLTGLIKANFPSRLAYKVSSKTDSRTILDANGAEMLLGRGDMLFLPAGGRMIRVHGPYASEEDLQNVVDFLRDQGPSPIVQTSFPTENQAQDAESGSGDELYERAKCLVMETGQASASLIQRRLRVGYPRAARLVEIMQEEGIVSPPLRDGRREVVLRRSADSDLQVG
ncbi:MAG: cell division protein FtsK [Nitrospiraceae bacterium]|nr:cell division protein FtsK [Nitrospiraceae bacterium]